jgi:hypothetical protein
VLEKEVEISSRQGEVDYFVMMVARIDAQSFNKDVGNGSSSRCLFGRNCNI